MDGPRNTEVTVKIQRKLAVTMLLGAGVGLCGCQSPSQGGLAFWKKDSNSSLASATPDVGAQRYQGLAKEFGSQSTGGATALGAQKPAPDNFLMASWKKTTGAVAGAFAAKPSTTEASDPLRLDQPTKKLGPEVHMGAAQLMENQGKFPEAEEHYQKALKQSPNNLGALVGLARLHDRQGHSRAALETYDRALKAHPQSGLVLNDLGLCLARQKQFDPALGALKRAVQNNPENPKYRNNLATVLVETGRVAEALQTLSAGSSPAVAHYNVGYLLAQRGQTNEAAQYFQQALAIDPALTQARDMLAQLAGAGGTQPMPQAGPYATQPRYDTAQLPALAANSYGAPAVEVPSGPRAGAQGYHLSDEEPAMASRGTQWGAYGTQPLPPIE